ncbi:MAG: hypothetical protein ABII64_01150 [Elusimicrobiota bacterium]
MDSIILIGPKIWGEDHRDFLALNKYTSIQYSAKTSLNIESKLEELQFPFDLFIYVPKTYAPRKGMDPKKGDGRVLFKGNVIEYNTVDKWSNRMCVESPWPTVGSRSYNIRPDLKYEYWFKLDKLVSCDYEIDQFEVLCRDGTYRCYNVSTYAPTHRGSIVFANKPKDIYDKL